MVKYNMSRSLIEKSTNYSNQLINKRLIGIFLTVFILLIPRITIQTDAMFIISLVAVTPYWVYYFNWKNKESKVIKEQHEAEYEVAKIIEEIHKIDKLKESGLMLPDEYLKKKQEYQNIYDKNKKLFLN